MFDSVVYEFTNNQLIPLMEVSDNAFLFDDNKLLENIANHGFGLSEQTDKLNVYVNENYKNGGIGINRYYTLVLIELFSARVLIDGEMDGFIRFLHFIGPYLQFLADSYEYDSQRQDAWEQTIANNIITFIGDWQSKRLDVPSDLILYDELKCLYDFWAKTRNRNNINLDQIFEGFFKRNSNYSVKVLNWYDDFNEARVSKFWVLEPNQVKNLSSKQIGSYVNKIRTSLLKLGYDIRLNDRYVGGWSKSE